MRFFAVLSLGCIISAWAAQAAPSRAEGDAAERATRYVGGWPIAEQRVANSRLTSREAKDTAKLHQANGLAVVRRYEPAMRSSIRGGMASYYTQSSCQKEGTSGIRTANGEVYDETAFTCALPTHQFGGVYRVCLQVRQPPVCVVVRHNDYGPGRGPRRKGVVMDLTPRAFAALAPLAQGVIPVSIEVAQ